ncbi:hypothetical protein H072_5238 [Dactylellina haptotyla CBS 200.50]|uniref:Uncharacterized protein n=1 Tax=Dactylellina haptotyla (strain CBS 200.50) TaxID=1284197 RepID=S8BZZ0_DACHA|nr:hypothetical protein H072_5238 [Dactylellina haptotyla CBS 200.50]
MSLSVDISEYAYLKDRLSAGRFIHASQQISAGTEILSVEDPLICIPDEAHLDTCCHFCMAEESGESSSVNQAYKPPAKLSFCLGCRVVKYCSKACQTWDWKRKNHKYECDIYKAQYPRVLPTAARVMLRMAKHFLNETPSAKVFGGIGGLKAHVEDFQKAGGERWEMGNLTAKATAEFSKGSKAVNFEPDFMRDLYCKLLINSVTVTTQTFDPIGICLTYQAAMFNHSCDPNAIMLFDGRRLSVRSLKDIAKDTEITISYIDNLMTRKERKRELSSRYFFDCKCSLCSTKTQPFEASSCHKCSKLVPYTSNSCPSCQEAVPEDDLTSAIAQAAAITEKREKKNADKSVDTTLKYIKSLYATNLLPSTYPPNPQLHQDLAMSYIDAGDWKSALLHLLTLYVRAYPVIYEKPFHPVRVVRTFTLAMVLIQVAVDAPEGFGERIDFTKVLYGLLTEISGNVEKSHGSSSGFAEMVRRKIQDVKVDMGIDSNQETDKWAGKGLGGIPELEGEVKKIIKMVDDFVLDLKKAV